jgi:hypothetical protein
LADGALHQAVRRKPVHPRHPDLVAFIVEPTLDGGGGDRRPGLARGSTTVARLVHSVR